MPFIGAKDLHWLFRSNQMQILRPKCGLRMTGHGRLFMRRQIISALILLSLGAVFSAPLRGDDRVIPPSVAKIWPVGVQRGTTATFTLDGRNLSDIRTVIFDSQSISAKVGQINEAEEEKKVLPPGLVETKAPVTLGKRQTATIEVTVAPSVAPGLHWFRVRTPLGTSNLMPFDIGSFPEVYANEKAWGHAEMQPEPTTLPATLVGTIAVPGQIDSYEFDGRAGEELVFQVAASRLGSMLESLLVIRNVSGQVLAESGQYQNRADVVLTYKLPQAGKYTLSVTDREKGGDKDHYYRIDAGPLPYITQVFPLGVRAGEPAIVSVTGINLGDLHEVKVDPPKSADGWTTMPLEVKSGGGWSLNTVKLAVGDDPEVLEQEPNNSPAQAQSVSLPVTINGHISGGAKNGGAADEDYFRFHARKNENVTIEVAAARLGSPLDSVIEVLDTQGNPIPRATLRCLNETVTTLSDRDSRSPGIRLTSTTGFHERDYLMVGDELDQLVYIADQPDEDVRMRSADGLRWAFLGTSPDVHSVNTPVYRVEILPPGAEFPPNGLPVFHLTWRNDDGGPGYGSDSRLNFVAPQDGDYIVRLKDVRGMEGQDFAYRLSLHDASPDYKLRAEPENPNIPKGGSTYVTVNANRVQGYEGPIEISVEGLPAGVKASPATIPAGQDSTVVLLSADASAPADALPAEFKIVGHAKINGHDLARVANEDAPLELASVIPPPDAVVTAEPGRITLEPGQDVKVTLHVERRNGFQGRVPCTVQNLPPGVRVVNVGLNGVLVTETQTTRTFTLHAEDWAKPITQPIYVIGEVESNSPTLHPSAPLIVEVVGNKETASASPAK
jgi:hypothetical protein